MTRENIDCICVELMIGILYPISFVCCFFVSFTDKIVGHVILASNNSIQNEQGNIVTFTTSEWTTLEIFQDFYDMLGCYGQCHIELQELSTCECVQTLISNSILNNV